MYEKQSNSIYNPIEVYRYKYKYNNKKYLKSIEIFENDIIKYENHEVGKVMIDKPYSFALIKIVDPELHKFVNVELTCGKSKIKILKPEWIT